MKRTLCVSEDLNDLKISYPVTAVAAAMKTEDRAWLKKYKAEKKKKKDKK